MDKETIKEKVMKYIYYGFLVLFFSLLYQGAFECLEEDTLLGCLYLVLTSTFAVIAIFFCKTEEEFNDEIRSGPQSLS